MGAREVTKLVTVAGGSVKISTSSGGYWSQWGAKGKSIFGKEWKSVNLWEPCASVVV